MQSNMSTKRSGVEPYQRANELMSSINTIIGLDFKGFKNDSNLESLRSG